MCSSICSLKEAKAYTLPCFIAPFQGFWVTPLVSEGLHPSLWYFALSGLIGGNDQYYDDRTDTGRPQGIALRLDELLRPFRAFGLYL